MKLWLQKSQNVKSKSQKAKLATASLATPQPAQECEGAHRWQGISFLGAHSPCPDEEATLAVRSVSSLRTEARRMHPFRTAPPRPAGPWVLTVKFNVHLILAGEDGPWHCALDFHGRSGCRGPSSDIGCGFLGTGGSPPGAYMLFANFPVSSFGFVSPRQSECDNVEIAEVMGHFTFWCGILLSFYYYFDLKEEAEIGEKGLPSEGAADQGSCWPP